MPASRTAVPSNAHAARRSSSRRSWPGSTTCPILAGRCMCTSAWGNGMFFRDVPGFTGHAGRVRADDPIFHRNGGSGRKPRPGRVRGEGAPGRTPRGPEGRCSGVRRSAELRRIAPGGATPRSWQEGGHRSGAEAGFQPGEGRWAGRRGARARPTRLGRAVRRETGAPPVPEDRLDQGTIFHAGDDPKRPAAGRTALDVAAVDASQALCPADRAAPLGLDRLPGRAPAQAPPPRRHLHRAVSAPRRVAARHRDHEPRGARGAGRDVRGARARQRARLPARRLMKR